MVETIKRSDVAPRSIRFNGAETQGQQGALGRHALGRQRRAEWNNEKHPLAGPLHYRWSNVKRLLLDLQDYE